MEVISWWVSRFWWQIPPDSKKRRKENGEEQKRREKATGQIKTEALGQKRTKRPVEMTESSRAINSEVPRPRFEKPGEEIREVERLEIGELVKMTLRLGELAFWLLPAF